jgi:hypothetical protein
MASAWEDFVAQGDSLTLQPKNRSCLYVQCIKRGPARASSQLNPVT